MHRVLMVASVASMIQQFNMPNLALLQGMGCQVEVACNFGKECATSEEAVAAFRAELERMHIPSHDLICPRSMLALRQIRQTYAQLKELTKQGHFDLVHTQSPIGGVLTRLAFRKARRQGTKIIYQAHGFHFFKGAPLKNWLLFYPIEKICSWFTDVLITINREDYHRAVRKFHAKRVEFVPGIGVNMGNFTLAPQVRQEKRMELGVAQSTKVLLSVGELNENKNHATVIRALAALKELDFVYIICGQGGKMSELAALADSLGLADRVVLTGFRRDVAKFYQAADCFVFPSYREGLSVALMEAMASGLPCVVSRIRGNTDLIDQTGGILVPAGDVNAWTNALRPVLTEQNWGRQMAQRNRQVIQNHSLEKVQEQMAGIYRGCLTGSGK